MFFSFAFCVDAFFDWITLIAVCWESHLRLPGIDFWASAVVCRVTVRLAVVGGGVTFGWVALEVKENAKSARSHAFVTARSCTNKSGSVEPGTQLKKDRAAKSHSSTVEPCCDSSADCARTPAGTVRLSIVSLWLPTTDSVADCKISSSHISGHGASVVVTILPLRLLFVEDERWIDYSCSTSSSYVVRVSRITVHIAAVWVHNLLSWKQKSRPSISVTMVSHISNSLASLARLTLIDGEK
jgi:hypothetical protein